MPRMPRATPGGVVYHVLNRANSGITMFRNRAEYAAFERALREAHSRVPVRLLAYCLMPTHWHLVIWPRRDRELSEFMRWLTVTHTRRWHAGRDASGAGHLYRGRYRSFPVEPGGPLAEVCRYVESNAKRSRKVQRAEEWPWSSLAVRLESAKKGGRDKGDKGRGGAAGVRPDDSETAAMAEILAPWPDELPRGWVNVVNGPLDEATLKALRNSAQRGTPFGSDKWRSKTVAKLHLEHTTRPRGRPRKHPLPVESDGAKGKSSHRPARAGMAASRKGRGKTTAAAPGRGPARRAATPLPKPGRGRTQTAGGRR